ncbi:MULTISPECIES: DotD/TraH family lipoprotein [unclassified Pseudomonas]|uniref:DotD/TraH family lipoprotein n=1 Tax=unclassified Pseudomonas TaxID=196821 RepID=UPI002AB3B1C1|nr:MULTISPECIES: DotD/TraH family lipoprotein [unclassified Pseudomonas]MDY7563423.1 DotD/TraH family lipoprotein [Pseudomonas sp. AB6]MEA9980006.1 DotD/TraH family lipoprotein [Pseudomonas sp. RTS4]MEA9996493.1 DotD/TraH family lipoprotein [Pseudomonas sp. AA4]MEB0198163.1 DotD/TraH family lipoprotein [Pseudomonas sp. 5S4]MEB0213492.1 DotD/TraH family lipoprotein [Pseudomonas sp. AB6]
MKLFIFAAPAVALLLAGCQAFYEKAPVQPATPDPALIRVIAQQQVLWQEGVMNTQSPLPADAIHFDGDLVSVTWSADAVELLSHLARQRDVRFTWAGVRLPLPVNVHASAVTYENLLHLIEMQTAWRATLHEWPGELALVFAQPQPTAGGRQ